MKSTIGDLKLRNFTDKGSNKTKCQIATEIDIETYMKSKLCGQNNSIVPYAGHQVYNGIINRINKVVSSDIEIAASKVYVFRDHLRYDGYCETKTPETENMPLLTKDTPIDDLVFERVIGLIKLQDNGEFSQTVAFKYEPKYVEIAFGTEVNVCANFNILGGKHYSTNQGFKYDDIMLQFEAILSNMLVFPISFSFVKT